MNTIDQIKSLFVYPDSYTMLSEVYPEYIDCLKHTESFHDELEWIQHFEDFEPFIYTVINNELVIVSDSISGDVIGSFADKYEFVADLSEAYREENAI